MKNIRKEFVVLDLEATCYNSEVARPIDFVNEIIEIGAIKVDKDCKEISRFGKFAKPLKFPVISEFCNELTTITQEDIDTAENLSDVLIEFFDWVDGATLISWGMYDKSQLQKDLIRNDLEYLLEQTEDHFSLKHLHGAWNKLKRGGIGLAGALRFEKLTFEGTAHRGIDDSINITKIFRKYIDRF
jgi:3'-5' exoribonuclease 1